VLKRAAAFCDSGRVVRRRCPRHSASDDGFGAWRSLASALTGVEGSQVQVLSPELVWKGL